MIYAGDSFNFSVSVDDEYSDWTPYLYLRGPDSIDLTGSIDDGRATFSEDATNTSSWTPGDYWYVVKVEDGSEVQTVDNGQLSIRADISNAGPDYDGRTEAETALAAIEAVLSNKATKDQKSYKIGDREIEYLSVSELLKLRKFYVQKVQQERARDGDEPLQQVKPIYIRWRDR